MTEPNKGLPVAGYTDQTDSNVAIVNQNKTMEEYVLRAIDYLNTIEATDKRWLALARTSIEQGFMAMNRAVFKPQRISGPIGLPAIEG